MSPNPDESNPFAPPTPDTVPKRGETHREFQLTAKGIRCRTGLELPQVCLVTGRTDSLEPIPIKLMWNSPVAGLIIIASPVLLAALSFGQLFILRYFPVEEFPFLRQQGDSWNSPLMFLFAIQIPMILAIVLSPKAALTGFVHRDIQRRMKHHKWLLFPTIFLFPISVGVIVFFLIQGAGVSLMILFGLFVIGSLSLMVLIARRNKKRFPGLALKAIGHQHGQFEVGGFSPVFLQAVKNPPEAGSNQRAQ